MFGNLSPQEIEELLHKQIVGRIGCYADNTIYVVPISYAYDGTYIYAHSEEGMKLKMMRKNPAVCFEVEDMDNMANWKSVIAWGNFEELASEARVEAIKKLLERTFPIIPSRTLKLSSQWPYMPQNFDEIGGIFYRIKLHTKTGRYENSLS